MNRDQYKLPLEYSYKKAFLIYKGRIRTFSIVVFAAWAFFLLLISLLKYPLISLAFVVILGFFVHRYLKIRRKKYNKRINSKKRNIFPQSGRIKGNSYRSGSMFLSRENIDNNNKLYQEDRYKNFRDKYNLTVSFISEIDIKSFESNKNSKLLHNSLILTLDLFLEDELYLKNDIVLSDAEEFLDQIKNLGKLLLNSGLSDYQIDKNEVRKAIKILKGFSSHLTPYSFTRREIQYVLIPQANKIFEL